MLNPFSSPRSAYGVPQLRTLLMRSAGISAVLSLGIAMVYKITVLDTYNRRVTRQLTDEAIKHEITNSSFYPKDK